MDEYVVDRVEAKYAILEGADMKTKMVALASLPSGVKEGDVITERDGVYAIDAAKTSIRHAHMRALMDLLE